MGRQGVPSSSDDTLRISGEAIDIPQEWSDEVLGQIATTSVGRPDSPPNNHDYQTYHVHRLQAKRNLLRRTDTETQLGEFLARANIVPSAGELNDENTRDILHLTDGRMKIVEEVESTSNRPGANGILKLRTKWRAGKGQDSSTRRFPLRRRNCRNFPFVPELNSIKGSSIQVAVTPSSDDEPPVPQEDTVHSRLQLPEEELVNNGEVLGCKSFDVASQSESHVSISLGPFDFRSLIVGTQDLIFAENVGTPD